jgi:hypothetical protein
MVMARSSFGLAARMGADRAHRGAFLLPLITAWASISSGSASGRRQPADRLAVAPWPSPPISQGRRAEWSLDDIYMGMMQFMVLQLLGLALIMIFPAIALWAAQLIYGR